MDRRIILAGGGHAHLSVLEDWARHPLPGTERWLVTSAHHTAYSGMFPGWLAGFYNAKDLFIDLRPLAERAGARLLIADVIGLDADAARIELSTGQWLDYDLLSLATGGEADVSSLAAIGDRLISAKPVSAFIDRWNEFLDNEITGSALNVAVVGGGAAGVELALAIAVSLRRATLHPQVFLVTPEDGFLAGHAKQVRDLALACLKRRGVMVRFATAVGTETGLLLSDGSQLACHRVIAATGSRAPRWLMRTALACSPDGFVAIGPQLQSISHANVLAAGDIVERVDRKVARSGVHAVKAGPVLAANLRAALTDQPMRTYRPRRRTLYLLSTADHSAILSWGPLVTSGHWVWRLKDWIDRHFIERFRSPC